jgi:hypothetical protein
MYFHNKLIRSHKCEYYLVEIWSNVKHFNWHATHSCILSKTEVVFWNWEARNWQFTRGDQRVPTIILMPWHHMISGFGMRSLGSQVLTMWLFRSRIGWPESAKVATVFLFFSAKNCLKNDKLDSKCSSRKVQQNCAISFWFHLHLVLHTFADILMWWGISFLHSEIWGNWELNKANNINVLNQATIFIEELKG